MTPSVSTLAEPSRPTVADFHRVNRGGGLFSEPIAVVVYILVALILAWPFIFKLIRRNRPARESLLPANSGAADYSD